MHYKYVTDGLYENGTVIRTGITYKKIPSYTRDSACRWKKLKYFEVMLNIYEFSRV